MNLSYEIEACVETLDEALSAQKNKATRLEVCEALEVEGLTPSINIIKCIIDEVSLPCKWMIRPRPGNFIFSKQEKIEMLKSIETICELGQTHFVVGNMTAEYDIDWNFLGNVKKAFPKCHFTLHKCIDLSRNIFLETAEAATSGMIDAILSSGTSLTALDGKNTLKKMNKISQGRIEIIGAGKITYNNLSTVHELIGLSAYHGRKIVPLH